MGPGESFGEEELVKESDRNSSVICTSAIGIVYVLKKKDFIKKVLQDKTAHKCLQEQCEIKIHWRNRRVEEYIQAIIEKPPEKPQKLKSFSISQSLYEYEKNRSPKVTNLISNKPKKKIDLNDFIKKEKTNLIPIDKSFFDPNQVKEILRETSVLKLLTSGSHKRNFMILNTVFKQQTKVNKERNYSEPNLEKHFEYLFSDKKITEKNNENIPKSQRDGSLPCFLHLIFILFYNQFDRYF